MAAKPSITVRSVTSNGITTNIITAGNGADVINATSLFGGRTGDLWEIIAGNGADTVNGSAYGERIWGDSANNTDTSANGADTLNGGGGNDVINGGNGADMIAGDLGADILFGDRGGDTFKYKLVSDSSATTSGMWSAATGDWIKDFRASEGDRIDLTLLNGQLAGNGPDMLQASSGASAYGVWVGVEGGYSHVYADTNGDGLADVAIRVTGTVTLSNITGLNYAPTALNDTLALDEDTVAAGSVAANDADPDGHTLTYALLADAPAGLTFNTDGSYSFDADSYDYLAAGVTEVVTVGYRTSDGHGGVAAATLQITITGTNDAPVVATEIANQSSDEDQPVSFSIAGDAFGDVDGDDLTYSATLADNTALPEWLSFDGETRTFTGTPPADWNGTVEVTVTASDGELSVSDTFDLVIAPVQDPPALTGTAASLENGTEDVPYTLTAAELLAGWTDVDGDVLVVVDVTADHARIIDNGDGTYTVIPDADYYGPVEISYEVSDGHGNVPATLSFEVDAVDDVPAYLSPAIYTGGGDPNDFDTLGNSEGENLSEHGGDDLIYGGAGSDTINGGGGNDRIYGGSDNDDLNGNNDGDTLYGGSGNDRIFGTNGGDRLIGGYGADELRGGNGADTFVYLSNSDTGDVILDFGQTDDDQIDLSAFDLDGGFVGALPTSGAVGANQFGYMHVDGNTILYVDTDGIAGADLEVTIVGIIDLTSGSGGDFFLG